MEDRKRILLIDFMYLWNRVYSVKGAYTGQQIFRGLKQVEDSDYYFRKIAVLDGENSSDRKRLLLPDYKENRSDKKDIYKALNSFLSKSAINLKTIQFVRNDKCEADELIAAYVGKYDKADKYIYSGDTDLYQLLRFNRTFIGTKYSRGFIIEPISQREAIDRYFRKYKVRIKDISYITKCKTFKGDSGDNIPIACPGMKTATIDYLLENFWDSDEPLNSKILLNMATYLKESGNKKDFNNFYENRKAIIRNYKLVQLGYSTLDVFSEAKTLQETGLWV